MKNYKKLVAIFVLIVFLTFFITVIFFINPQELVWKIDVTNGYILAFIFAFFGCIACLEFKWILIFICFSVYAEKDVNLCNCGSDACNVIVKRRGHCTGH